MTEPTFDNGVVQLYQGDARQVLGELPAESVHCVVTSPPYWGLRDYGLEPLVWGGEEGHEHEWGEEGRRVSSGGLNSTTIGSGAGQASSEGSLFTASQGAFCPCGAWRGSLGLEPTIDLYVQHIVEIFREIRRVLRKDGTLWLNMGDSYAGSWGAQSRPEYSDTSSTLQGRSTISARQIAEHPRMNGGTGSMKHTPGLKPKDLCMMPARVALALQADGWWLRKDIVWSKPNPMPESVTDRPTTSHEYLFLLTKAERYYYDADAIKEEVTGNTHSRGPAPHEMPKQSEPGLGVRYNSSFEAATWGPVSSRNKRSVWEIATEPYPEAHFATFPQKLVEPCILAGTSERGVCPDCGAPWERVVERERSFESGSGRAGNLPVGKNGPNLQGGGETLDVRRGPVVHTTTTGWRPTCECGHDDTIPGIVLDSFAGSGTVAYVAQRLGRRSIGIDLSAEYLALAAKRLQTVSLPMSMT